MKIRIYKLAKELKIDIEKMIETARGLGEKVSVPANSVSPEIADKIRDKFSKKSK